MRFGSIFAISCLLIAIAGCQSQLNGIVGTDVPKGLIPTPTPSASRNAFKISPGSLRSTTAHYGISTSVSPTTQNLKSTSMSARLAISRYPANPL